MNAIGEKTALKSTTFLINVLPLSTACYHLIFYYIVQYMTGLPCMFEVCILIKLRRLNDMKFINIILSL